MKIYIGSDHRGFHLKEFLKERLKKHNHNYEVIDEGAFEYDPNDDYPLFAFRVGERVASNENSRGILLCGSGAGVCIAANKVKGVRALMSKDPEIVKMARRDDDVNILCLPSDFVSQELAWELVEIFLSTDFEPAERHIRRIKQIENYEKGSGTSN